MFILFLHMCMFPACWFRQRTYRIQGLVNGVLKETWTDSGFQFEWFSVGDGFILRSSFLFLIVCLPSSALPLFDIWYVFVDACVCIGVVLDFANVFSSLCAFVSVCHGDFFFFRVCKCGSVVWNLWITFFPNSFCRCVYIHISMNVCIYIYIYMCVCVCVCGVCVCFQLDVFVREFVWYKI